MTLIRYMRPHKGNLSVILITMLLSVGLGVLRPWPIKILLDNVLGTHPLGRGLKHLVNTLPGTHDKQALLLYIAIALVVIFALSTVIQMFNTIASISFGQRMVFDLGGDLFLHVQRLSLLFHSRRPVGDTIARVTGDPYSVQELVTGVLIPLLSNIITIATILLVMLRINVVMTLISLGIIPFFVLGVRLFREPMKARVRERRDLEGTMMSVVERSLNAIPAVQSNTREDREYGVYSERATETVRAYVRSTYAQLWFQLVVGFVSAAGISAIIYVGGHYALDGKITPGTVVLFFLYLNQLYNPLTSITYTAASYQSAAAKADRVLEILDTPLDIQDAPDAQEVKLSGDVCVEDVTFGYIPNRPVLKGISLVARPGEVVAIVGPTGAGKTTLVSMLVRFFDPWNGRVTIDGIDIRRLKVRSLRQQIAIVLQDPFIFPLTVAENIAYGRPDATRAEIVAAAQAANADEFIRRLPDGYAKACLTEVRHSVEALRPDEASAGSLQEQLRKLVAEFETTCRESGITLDLEEATHPLHPELCQTLYRCAQEALTNIRKHAHATKVLLRLSTSHEQEGQVELTVLDNGQGWPPEHEQRASGFGLLGMRERVVLLDGTLRAGPEPGHGWRVEVVLPLTPRGQAEGIATGACETREKV